MGKLKKLRKTAKKATKKAKNSTEKVAKNATQEVKETTKSIAQDVEKATKQTTKYAGKKFNYVTGAIEDTVEKALDYDFDDLKTAVNYAEKTWNKGTDWVEDLAKDAIDTAYRAAYKNCVGKYIKFAGALTEAQYKILAKDNNILIEIRDNLLDGKFSKSMDNLSELLDSDVMKKSVDIGHGLFGTSFILAADVSVGGSYKIATASGGGAIGLTRMLDNYNKYKYDSCIFTAAGGSFGLTTPGSTVASASVELGITMGFLAKDPTNIGGWFVDASGQASMDSGHAGLGMSWSPPGKKAPYFKPTPVAGVVRAGWSKSTDASGGMGGSIAVGPSYTWIIQKIKNNFYKE